MGMTSYYDRDGVTIYHGDCLDVMRTMEENSIDAVCCDPPYGLEFMGKDWDHGVPGVPFWEEALRVAKPGAHLLAFGGTRTHHRLMCAIEDAGWEIRDCIMWIYGSGFPKSLDIGKAIDKSAGAEREVVGESNDSAKRTAASWQASNKKTGMAGGDEGERTITAPATDDAKQWDGWGTGLKPAAEIIVLARKPLTGTVAQNVMQWGTGGINVDGCRIGTDDGLNGGRYSDNKKGDDRNTYCSGINLQSKDEYVQPSGRFPSNVIHDGSDEVLAGFPETASGALSGTRRNSAKTKNVYGDFNGHNRDSGTWEKNSGLAARFFYCAKSSASERGSRNNHPTVKPVDLIRYLVRLVTPPDGVVLDPFLGSGTTTYAAREEGFRSIGCEKEEQYCEIAVNRLRQGVLQFTR